MKERKYNFTSCFLLTPSGYREMSYTELCWRAKLEPSKFRGKKFLVLHGMLMEVTPDVHSEFKSAEYRSDYLQKLAHKHRTISFEMAVENGSNDIPAAKDDVPEEATTEILIENMLRCLHQLTPDEQALINALFFEWMTERELSAKTGIPQKTINNRKKRILQKLKKLMKL